MQASVDSSDVSCSRSDSLIKTISSTIVVDKLENIDEIASTNGLSRTSTVVLSTAPLLANNELSLRNVSNLETITSSSYSDVTYLGSNVEQMSVTPSSSPQTSPSKRWKVSALTPLTMTAPVSSVTILTNIDDMNNSNSSSNSESNSNSTTSSVIATPILAHNGVAVKTTEASSDPIENKRSTPECHDFVSAKMLPLPKKLASFTTFDEQHYLKVSSIVKSETSTPLTPSSSSSNSSTTPSPAILSSATSASSTPATTPNLRTTSSMDENLLQWKDMPQYLQFNPYVLKGYRPLQTFKGCLFSLFYWHNETINILTHAIPIVYILTIVPWLMPWEKGYRFLSFCHVFGSVAPWCGSFIYHLFMNIEKGENVYYRLLKLDMVGIWVSQSFGALPLVIATTFCFSFKWKWLIIITYCLVSLWGLYKALTAGSPWQRRLCFALPVTMRAILTFLRTMHVVGGSHLALSHVYLQDGVSVLGGAIGAMRIPEKWFPGLVDFYLNSHNIMHVLVVVAVYSMHEATIKDFEWMSSTTCCAYTNTTDNAIDASINANIEL